MRALFAYTERTLSAAGTPGAVVVVASARGAIGCRGFGVDGSGRPMTCNTPIVLASLTKGFTAIAVLQLVQAGQVDLNRPVRAYVPWFRVADEAASNAITVRNLLEQRSGFSESTGLMWLASRETGEAALERRVRALAAANLFARPGTSFQYSNANYDVLGVLIASVSAASYEAYVKAHVLQPIGVQAAHFTCGPSDPHGYVRVFSVPVRAGNQPELCADVPAGGLVMPAVDYGRYLAANLDAGRTWSRTVLDRRGWEMLQHSPADMPYAMGWFESIQPNGTRELRHMGAAPDFRNYAVVLPQRDIAAARLSNANEMPDGGRSYFIESGFARTLEGKPVAAAPLVPPDLYLRLLVLAACIAQIVLILRRRTQHGRRPLMVVLNLVAAAAILWYALPKWGWAPAVGFAYSPDLAVLLFALVAALLVGAAFTLKS